MPKKRLSPQDGVVSVIMAGGIGARLWPLGTPQNPKQFLRVLFKQSLFEQALERARLISSPDKIFVVTHRSFKRMAAKQAPDVPLQNILAEPQRKDTAAAIILTSLVAENKYPGDIAVVMPADHVVRDLSAFQKTIAKAVRIANKNKLVLLGVKPTFAATDYGYLKLLRSDDSMGRVNGRELECFVEKPNYKRALEFINDGNYLWNSGIFVWRSDVLLKQAKRYLPDHYAKLRRAAGHFGQHVFADELQKSFEELPAISIDYGILEKTDQLMAFPVDFDWSDLGTWPAVEKLVPKDGTNHLRGRVFLANTKDNLIINEKKEPILTRGVNNLVIINTKAGLLVCAKKDLGTIKEQIKKILREK